MQGCASTVVKPFAIPTRFEYLIRNGKTDLPFCSLFRIILNNIAWVETFQFRPPFTPGPWF